MKLVIQRVKQAEIVIQKKSFAKIKKGLLVLVGFKRGDSESTAVKLIDKLIHLRIFSNTVGRMDKDLIEVNGELLIVPQFTLYADTRKGNRPSFIEAEIPIRAQQLFNFFVAEAKRKYQKVANGEFGADMKVSLINDGPVTIILEL